MVGKNATIHNNDNVRTLIMVHAALILREEHHRPEDWSASFYTTADTIRFNTTLKVEDVIAQLLLVRNPAGPALENV